MTKAEMFAQIRSHLTDADELAFIDHELELLAKKNSSRSKKPTQTQAANADLVSKIYDVMENGVQYRVSDIQALLPELADLKIQKVTALVTRMRNEILVSREMVKGVAYFTKI